MGRTAGAVGIALITIVPACALAALLAEHLGVWWVGVIVLVLFTGCVVGVGMLMARKSEPEGWTVEIAKAFGAHSGGWRDRGSR